MADTKDARPAYLLPDNSYNLLIPVDYMVGSESHQLTKVQLRRLNGEDLLMIDGPGTSTQKLFLLLEKMTGLLRVVTGKIDAVDLDRIDECIGYFREPGSVTGATS
jgi:hypothetical protein